MTSTPHPPVDQRKGRLAHEHRGATWHPTACEAHRAQPCPIHDPATFDLELAVEKGLHPVAGFQESCEACRKMKQVGHQPDCAACVETWDETREHMVAVQLHQERFERRGR